MATTSGNSNKGDLMRYLIVLTFLLLTGCVNPHYSGMYANPKNNIKAIGYSLISTQPSKNKQERVLMAIQASKQAAYKELAEQIYGNVIMSNVDASGGIISDSRLHGKTGGIIKGARIVKSYPADDYYITEVEMDLGMLRMIFDANNGDLLRNKIKIW